MDVLRSVLVPEQPGLLPKWLIFTSLISFFNAAQTYYSAALTQRVYPAANATPLTARLFGTWTTVSGVVRLFAAHRLADPAVYWLALSTYLIALGHFASELLAYRTTRAVSGATPTFVVAIGTLGWMLATWGEYVQER